MSNTSVKVFSSTDPGALVLSGTAGALSTLLKTYLVDGRGSGAVATLTVAAGIATATYGSGHPFAVGSVGLFEGATPAGLNGQKRILSVATNSVTFDATGIADSNATGSITSKLASAGWQQVFSGTNITCLKPTVPEATGCVLRIDDTGTINARVCAYESMTDASTGIGPTPLESQVAGGLYWYKSVAANSAARPWVLVADERKFYFGISPSIADSYTLYGVGDISSLKSGDAYAYIVSGNLNDSVGSVAAVPAGCLGYSRRNDAGGAYLVRSHTGIGTAVGVQRLGAHHNGGTADVYAGTAGYSVGTYPNGPNNGLMTSTLEINAGGAIRGSAPGLLHPVHSLGSAFSTGSIVSGTDDFAGRQLYAVRVGAPNGANIGTVFVDVTGPWAR